MKLLNITSLLILLVLVSSCYKDKIDTDLLNDLRFNPELEVPIVNATLSLADIVEKDTSGIFIVDQDNFVTIKYKQDALFEFSPGDFVEIPDQDPQIFPVVVGQPPVGLNMSLGTIGGVQLGTSEFFSGNLELILSSPVALSEDVEVKLTISNAQKGSQDLSQSVTLSAGDIEVVDSTALPGFVFDFSNGGQNVNYISLGIELVNPPAGLLGSALSLSIQFKGLSLDYANGYFGDRIINIPSGNFDFDLSGIEKLASGFRISNPDIKLLLASSVGLPVELAPDLDGINSANAVTSLGATPQLIAAATDTIGFDTSVIAFNSTNSNIADFIAALPSTILYSGKATLNPAGPTTSNFISRNSALSASIDIELPLEISIDNSILEQELTGINIFSDNPEELEELTLIFRSSNGFPFDLDLSVAFLDSVTQDSVFGFDLGLLQAAITNSNGEILTRGKYATPREITFTKADFDILKSTNTIRFKARLNTPGGAPKKFYTHFDTQISIAARVKINAEL